MKNNQARTEQKKQASWQEHIQSWEQSGLSQKAYCRAQSLGLSTFGYWRRKINHGSEDRPRFYPLTVMPSLEKQIKEPCGGLQLIIGEKRFLIEISNDFSEQALKRLIVTLEQL